MNDINIYEKGKQKLFKRLFLFDDKDYFYFTSDLSKNENPYYHFLKDNIIIESNHSSNYFGDDWYYNYSQVDPFEAANNGYVITAYIKNNIVKDQIVINPDFSLKLPFLDLSGSKGKDGQNGNYGNKGMNGIDGLDGKSGSVGKTEMVKAILGALQALAGAGTGRNGGNGLRGSNGLKGGKGERGERGLDGQNGEG